MTATNINSFRAAIIVLTMMAATSNSNVYGAPFSPSNIVALRVQDDTGILTNTSAELFLDEYTANGSLVQTIPIPASGANALVISGFSVAEGALTLSSNGRWLCFGGYSAPIGVTNIPNTTSVQCPRVVATVDLFGNYQVVASNTNFYSGDNMRGATTDGTNNFWGVGAIAGTGSGGLCYYGFAASPALVYSLNLRVVNLFNGALYCSTANNGGQGVYKFIGEPEAGATPTRVISTGSGSSPYGFVINPAGNIAYVADDRQGAGGGIQRYTNSLGTWSLRYTLATGVANTGARGLAVDWSGANPIIYASTSDNTSFGNPANRLIKIVDTGPGSVATTLATTATNSSFRGVSLVPQAIGPQSQMQGVIPVDSDARVNWSGIGGSNYVMQATTNLGQDNPDASFTDISPVLSLPGTGVVVANFLDAGALSNSSVRLYRIRSN